VRPVHPGEERPPLAGELQVVDCETGRALALSFDDAARRRYEAAYRDFVERLEAFAKGRRASVLHLRSDVEVVPQIASLFPGGVLRV